MSKTLILYSYRDYQDSASNFKYFLTKTLPLLGEQVHLAVAYNNDRFIKDTRIKLNNTISFIRTTATLDLGDFAILLKNTDISKYNFFVFTNSSCIGPILPTYIEDNWIKIITRHINNSTKLVGPIVEVPPDYFGVQCLSFFKYIVNQNLNIPFMHSYFFATDQTGLNLLLRYKSFPNHQENKDQGILFFERLISSSILNEGYDLKSFTKAHQEVIWSDKKNWDYKLWSNTEITCPEIPGNYYDTNLDPYEVMFFKNIRFPHEHRSEEKSGISEHNKNYISKILLRQ